MDIYLTLSLGLLPLAKSKECPAPQPISLTFQALCGLGMTYGENTFVSVPVPHIPCSFQPKVMTVSVPKMNLQVVQSPYKVIICELCGRIEPLFNAP